MLPLIKLQQVTKTYRLHQQEFTALNGVDFELRAGEMTAIVGASGSGKSTLLNIIGCLDHATSGNYFFANRDVSQLTSHALADIRNQQMGFVFQSFFLLPRSSALQNVMLPLFYRGIAEAKAAHLAMKMLEKVAMAQHAEQRPNQLSGGQQQRVAIARALVGDPQVILADEPTGALDSTTGNEVMALLLKLNQQEGRTILIITHDKEISRRCKRVVNIKDGRIVSEEKN